MYLPRLVLALTILATTTVRAADVGLSPVDDARVRNGASSFDNYDTEGLSISQGCPDWCDSHLESLLKFDLTTVGTTINAATLRLWIYSAGTWSTTGEILVHLVGDDSWVEETVTWDTAPGPDYTEPSGNAIGTAGPYTSAGFWVEIPLDLATVVAEQNGDGQLSLRAVPDSAYQHIAHFYDKEHTDATLHPQLLLEVDDYVLQLTDATVQACDPAELRVLLDVYGPPAHGFAYSVCSGSDLGLLDVVSGSTTQSSNPDNGGPPDFEALNILLGGFTHAVVIDLDAVYGLPVGTGYELSLPTYRPLGAFTTTTASFCGMGSPLVSPEIVSGSMSVVPLTVPGTVTITGLSGFTRGDPDSVGGIDVSDQVYLMEYLYAGGPEPLDCYAVVNPESGDTNDNEFITVADALLIGASLFCGTPIVNPLTCECDWTEAGLFPATESGFEIKGTVIPSGPTVEIPVRVDSTTPVKALSVALDFGMDLTPSSPSFILNPLSSATANVYTSGNELMLVVTPDSPCGTLFGAGSDQAIGTLIFDTTGAVICPTGVQWIPSFTMGSVDHPNTIVDDGFADHHPVLTLELDCNEFIRGDGNGDGAVDIGDAIAALDHLFASAPLGCETAGDANDDGGLDIADAIFTLDFLFATGPAPAAPYPACGLDPTPGAGATCVVSACP